MKTSNTTTINASGDKIWGVFAHEFDHAYQWMASIPKSYGKDNGQLFEGAKTSGRICELDGNPNGPKAKESFLAYDEKKRCCSILIQFIDTPFGFPLVQNVADFELTETGNNQSVVTFTVKSTFKPFGYLLYPMVKLGFKIFVKQIMEELKFFVETGKPHPRKVKAFNDMTTASSA